MKPLQVQVKVDVQPERVAQLINFCFSPDFNVVNKWATLYQIDKPTYLDCHFSEVPLNEGGVFWISVPRFRDDCEGNYILDSQNIEKGLQYMAEQDPVRFAEILNEECTCETAETFLQFCLFGTVVFW